MNLGGSAASNTVWINPVYTTTTTTLGPYHQPSPQPLDELDWLRQRVAEIVDLTA